MHHKDNEREDMKIIKQQKTKYDYGVNTFITLDNNESYTISSMRLLDGTTTYNVYKGWNDTSYDNLILEDSYNGYWEILKMLKGAE